MAHQQQQQHPIPLCWASSAISIQSHQSPTLPVLPWPSPRRCDGIVGTSGAGSPATSTGTANGASFRQARMAEERVALELASRQFQQPTDLLVDQNGKLFWGDSSSWIGRWDYTTNAWHTNGDSGATASSNPWARYSQCGLQPLGRCRLCGWQRYAMPE